MGRVGLLVVTVGGVAVVLAVAPFWLAASGLAWLGGILATCAVCAAAGRADRAAEPTPLRSGRFDRGPVGPRAIDSGSEAAPPVAASRPA